MPTPEVQLSDDSLRSAGSCQQDFADGLWYMCCSIVFTFYITIVPSQWQCLWDYIFYFKMYRVILISFYSIVTYCMYLFIYSCLQSDLGQMLSVPAGWGFPHGTAQSFPLKHCQDFQSQSATAKLPHCPKPLDIINPTRLVLHPDQSFI